MKVTSVKEIFSIDVRSAAIFRMLLGVYIIVDSINRITLVPAFYSDKGIYPRSDVFLENFEFAYHFHLMFLSGSEWFATLFLSLLLIAGISLLIGFKTKLSTFVCWLLFCSVIVREGVTANSGDILLIQLLFWGFFLKLGAVWSVDSILAKKENETEKRIFSAATVGLYAQFVLIYISTGYFKGQYLSWLDGSHMQITFSRIEYMRPLAFHFSHHTELLSFLTWFTLILELFGPLLFFIPVFFVVFRLIGVFLFTALQIGIVFFMNVGFFPIASLAGVLVFLPSAFWDWLGNKIPVYRGLPWQLKPSENSSINRLGESSHPQAITIQTKLQNSFLAVVVVYISLWTVSELPNRFKLSDSLKKPGYFLKLDQRWAMFSSTVYHTAYYEVIAHYPDGQTADLLESLKKEYNSPSVIPHITFTNFRWRKFITERLHQKNYRYLKPNLMNYLNENFGDAESQMADVIQIDLVENRFPIHSYTEHLWPSRSVLFTKNLTEINESQAGRRQGKMK